MIVVDSSVWIAHFRGLDTAAVRKFRLIERPTQIVVGDLILLEILQGARNEGHAATLENLLRQFKVESMTDAGLATTAARNYRALRSQGVTVRTTIDLIIATFCLERGHDLLHDDRDFDPMVSRLGLRVI